MRIYHKNKISLRFNINTYFLRNIKDVQIDNGNCNALGRHWSHYASEKKRDAVTGSKECKSEEKVYKYRMKKHEIDKASKSGRYQDNFA